MTERLGADEASYQPRYAAAAERIIAFIEGHGLKAGDRLPTEADFAALLGVSRSIARDAIKTLAALGRISTQRGRGIFVAESSVFPPQLRGHFKPTNLDDIMMVFEFRATQEKAAAELAATRATPAELVAIQSALNDYARHVTMRELDMLGPADTAFHSAVNHASHNQFFVEAAKSATLLQREVNAVAFGGPSGGPVEQALQEHADIFDAIRRGDAAAAGAAAVAHIDRTMRGFKIEVERRVFHANPG